MNSENDSLATHLPPSKRTLPGQLPPSKRRRRGSCKPSSPTSTQEHREQLNRQSTKPHQIRLSPATTKIPTPIPTGPIPNSSPRESDEIPAEPHREAARLTRDVACGADFLSSMELYRIDVGTPAWMEEALRI